MQHLSEPHEVYRVNWGRKLLLGTVTGQGQNGWQLTLPYPETAVS